MPENNQQKNQQNPDMDEEKRRTERVERIVNFSKKRSQDLKEKVLQVLQEIVDSGETVTFYKVAQLSGASKSFLYTNQEVHDAIKQYIPQTPLVGEAADNSKIKRLQRISKQQRTEIRELNARKDELTEKVFQLQKENDKLRKLVEITDNENPPSQKKRGRKKKE